MTYKTKSLLKRMTAHAFEVCVGSTIYSAMSDVENKIINKLYAGIRNKTTYSYNIKMNVSEEQTNLLEVINDELRKGINATGDASSQYPPSKLVFFKKTPILIVSPRSYMNKAETIKPMKFNYGEVGAPVVQPVYSFKPRVTLTQFIDRDVFSLITFNTKTHKENLNKYIEILKKKAIALADVNKEAKYISITSSEEGNIRMKKRSFDTVFMDQKTKDDLIHSIDSFVNKKDWYDRNFVPYHYGILLYGPPGTGKSTLIRAVITEYFTKYKACSVPKYLSRIGQLCSDQSSGVPFGFDGDKDSLKPRLVILEDIDASLLQKRKPGKTKEQPEHACSDDEDIDYYGYQRPVSGGTSLSEVLNTIDGVANAENVIYIFTTNHIDKLDPALLRPGRIDKIIKVDKPNRDCYDQFMHYHFGKHIPDDVEVYEDKLIAELQNEIVCEKSFDEIIGLLSKPKQIDNNNNS